MSLIKLLSENLVNQIAAGEVVERPASVVKELVENSLDAGADKISIELKDGGKTYIKVFDNGKGMSAEDLELSIQRHATSKISEESDLWKIKTMGFRGEALASIASVSKMSIRSKTSDDVSGMQIDVNGGDLVQKKDVGMVIGTELEVFDLFFNTPARQKYLSKDSTELSHITSLLDAMALANTDVSFKLIHNGKIISDLPKVTDLSSRISDIFGKATSEAMLPIFYGGTDFQIDGFIGKPLLSRSSTKHQYFFVNGRPIQHFVLANTIKSAFHSMLMENKKPVFVINIKIDPSLVDVNVHPRKLEVRFEDQQTMVKTMYGCVKSALEKHSLAPMGFTESRRYMSDNFPSSSGNATDDSGTCAFDQPPLNVSKIFQGNNSPSPRNSGGNYSASTQEALSFSKEILNNREQNSLNDYAAEAQEQANTLKPIAQIQNSYIVAQNEEGLVLVDQHAAHERCRYEELMRQYKNQEKSVQPLLVDMQIEFTADEVVVMEENMDVFEGLGFEVEHFGGNTFVVRAVPTCLVREDIDVVVKGVLDDIQDDKAASNMQGRIETILTSMACRSAIMFGQSLSMTEMESLLEQIEKQEQKFTCPHGRPTMVALNLNELGKMFGRK